ncbi:hypothetical protein GOP47_0000797 [Adiantum capillus-veneris]|uniref:Uncharacterized protein n=1 Tax=Adiantum capillus-veneris TaxID=13818 RepID=A0A9D4VE75_ADICA|nr:hypothetical protein GOP47_0000797 [Adiantum capillus-veneris]
MLRKYGQNLPKVFTKISNNLYLNCKPLKAWQEEQTSKRAKLERKRNQIFVAKLLEYDCLQPGSDDDALRPWGVSISSELPNVNPLFILALELGAF